MFLNCVWRHLWYFGDTMPIVSERAKTNQVAGSANLAPV